MSRSKKKSSSIGWLILLFVAFGAAWAAGSYLFFSKSHPKVSVHAVKPDVPISGATAAHGREVTIYLPESTPKGSLLAPVTRRTDAKGGILDAAMDALLTASREKGPAADLIPQGAKLLSPIKVSKGVAEVNFSKEFVDNFSGGSDQEALTLNSIAHTLVHNSGGEVKKVRILVEGNTAETLGGHFELTDPIAADSTMLKPGK